jgi:hypothetical protein
MDSAKRSDYYSHIILIPLFTGYLIYSKRKEIIGNHPPAYGNGGILTIGGMALYSLGFCQSQSFDLNDRVSLLVFSAVIFWIGGFILLYGLGAFRKNPFPFLFLFFMILIPRPVMDKIINVP